MSISTSEKKKLETIRKWVKKERRRYRLSAQPKFSIGVDNRTKKIIVRYSIYEVVGYNIKKDEAKTKLKRKNIYTSFKLNDYELLNVRRVYNQIVKDIEKANKQVISDSVNIHSWVDKYITNEMRYGKKLSPRTLKSDKDMIVPYVKWLEENHPKYLDIYNHIDGGKKVLEEYLLMKTNKGYSKNTIANSYRRIKGFFNWLSDEDESIPYNMLKMKGYSIERNADKLPPATSIDDMKVLIKWMDDNKENKYERHFIPILRMLLLYGCRISEVVEMKIKDINVKTKIWEFFSKSSWRQIKLDSESLWRDLDYWVFDKKGKVRTDKEYVFHLEYWRRGGKDGKGGGVKMNLDNYITMSGVEHKFKKVILELGLNPKLTPHSCRRGYITYMLEKTNGNVPQIAYNVGHKTWDIVRMYNRARLPKERMSINFKEVLENE